MQKVYSMFAVIAFLFFTNNVSAATYYVSTNGNDSNNGSINSPWRTIKKSFNTAIAGDVVYIRGGTYNEENLKPANSGSAGNYITFSGYANETAIINGGQTSKTSSYGLIDISNKSYIKIQDLTIKNYQYGIYVSHSDHITLENNKIDFMYSSCIHVGNGDDILITKNELTRCTHGIGGSAPHYAPHEWISIRGSVTRSGSTATSVDPSSRVRVSYNYLHSPNFVDGQKRSKEGIDLKQGVDTAWVHNNVLEDIDRTALYIDAYEVYTKNIEVYNNIATRSLHGLVIAVEQDRQGVDGWGAYNIKVYNNLFYNNEYYGIWVTHYLAGGPIWNVDIANNTLYKNQGGPNNHSGGIQVSTNHPSSSNIVLQNNLYDRWSLNSKATAGLGNKVLSDSDFVKPGTGNIESVDFKLRGTSGAINSGTNISWFNTDIIGVLRPQGGKHDSGAYEYGGTPQSTPTPTPTSIPTVTPTNTPSPTPTVTIIPSISPSPTVSPTPININTIEYDFRLDFTGDNKIDLAAVLALIKEIF